MLTKPSTQMPRGIRLDDSRSLIKDIGRQACSSSGDCQRLLRRLTADRALGLRRALPLSRT